jgi:hypothetical protein
MRMKLALTLLFGGLLVGTANASEDSGVTAFDRLNSAVKQAQASISSRAEAQPSLTTNLLDVSNVAEKLSGLYRATLKKKQPPNSLPRVYLLSLDSDSSALEGFPKLSLELRSSVAINIRDDLMIKFDYASSFPGGAFASVVRVTVETEHEGKPVSGLWVRCNPVRDGVTKDPMYVFNSATTPTTSQLPPGSLIMWLESASGGNVIAQQQMKIGEGGIDHETIKFPVP